MRGYSKAGLGRGVCRMSTVAENTIKLNFVDVDGNRASVPGRIGQSLLDVALQHGIDLEGACGGGGGPTEVRRTENWVETTYGEGPQCFYCHVQLPSSYNHVLPEAAEIEMSRRLARQRARVRIAEHATKGR